MEFDKYVGLDVHKASIVSCVVNSQGQRILESLVATKAEAVRDLLGGIGGRVAVALEEGTHAAWLYEVIKPLVAEVVVCDARVVKGSLGVNKSDRADAHKLAELLRLGGLRPISHGHEGTQRLKQLVHGYDSLVKDATRLKNRIKALSRGRGIETPGRAVYRRDQREAWLGRLTAPGVRERAEWYYAALDQLQELRRKARVAMVRESRQQPAAAWLVTIPGLGPIRVAYLLAAVGTPHRFRSRRQFWNYCGLAVVTAASAEYEMIDGQVRKKTKATATRGLNQHHNHRLKELFKSAALRVQSEPGFAQLYEALLEAGRRPELARLQLARKLAALTLSLWKKGVGFVPERLISQSV